MGATQIISIKKKRKAQEVRAHASINCVHYQKCRDEAAYANRQMQCHKCEKYEFEQDIYQKEVNLANISRSGAGEQSVKVGEISCPANATGDNCKDRGGRKGIMDQHKKDEMETKVCSQADCEHAGQPQPIENFGIHGPSGKKRKMCNACFNQRLRDGHQRRHERKKDERLSEPKAATSRRPTSNKKPVADATSLTIDFSNHLKVFESIKQIAEDELRTPGNQVLYWLKEFSIIVQKEDAL